jgi:hypothetical protein
MKCESCKKETFTYERKIIDEKFLLCEDCDWSTEDIEIANKLGDFFISLIRKDYNEKNKKKN